MSKRIYRAGGCFWGLQKFFDQFDGVIFTEVGYANGKTPEPKYEQLYRTGHAETVLVEYEEPAVPDLPDAKDAKEVLRTSGITLSEILDYYFMVIDPVSLNRQGLDCGTQYRTGIYYTETEQLPVIEQKMSEVAARYPIPLMVEVMPLENYYPAEDYHQKYLDNNPLGYCHIGRDMFKLQEKR